MIIDASAKSLGYKPGDTITLELSSGRKREIKLAGYVHDVTGFPYNLAKRVNAYVTPDTLEWLGGNRSSYDMLAVSVAEKQTDAEACDRSGAGRCRPHGTRRRDSLFCKCVPTRSSLCMEYYTRHFLRARRAWLSDRFIKRIPDRQHHHCLDDPADTADRHHESRRRRHIADRRHVRCFDLGLWTGRIVDRGPAGKCRGTNYRRRNGGMVEFPCRTLSRISSHTDHSKYSLHWSCRCLPPSSLSITACG